MIQWIYETIYTAVGEMFADINNLDVEIFDLSWVQAVVNLFTLLGWTLFVVGVVVAVFEVAMECQTGRVSIKGAALNVLKGFFAASLVGVLPVQLYKLCCSLQGNGRNPNADPLRRWHHPDAVFCDLLFPAAQPQQHQGQNRRQRSARYRPVGHPAGDHSYISSCAFHTGTVAAGSKRRQTANSQRKVLALCLQQSL